MKEREISISEARELICPIIGKKTWDIKLSPYHFVTFEFGKPIPPDYEGGKIHGEFHLWLYDCDWRIQKSNAILAELTDDYSDKQIQDVLKDIEGLAVIDIVLIEPNWNTNIRFDQDVSLSIYSNSLDDINYTLFIPGDKALVFGPRGKIMIEED